MILPTKHVWVKGQELTECTVCGAAYRHPFFKGMPSKHQDDNCWKYFSPAMDEKTNKEALAYYIALRRLGGFRSAEEVRECASACGFKYSLSNLGLWMLIHDGTVEMKDWQVRLVKR